MGFHTFISQPRQAPTASLVPMRQSNRARAGGTQMAQGPRHVNAPGSGNYFEALRDSKDRSPIPTYLLDYRFVIRSLNRERLAGLAYYLADNCGQVSYAIEQISNYSVPIMPQAASPNPDWNKAADAWWLEWCKRADFTGRFNFDALQELCCEAMDGPGDIGIVATSENGFPQVQLIESCTISTRNVKDVTNTIDGVQVDAKRRVVGYWVEGAKGAELIDAGQMFLLYDADRYSNYRGISPIRRGSNDIRDAQDIKGFEKIRAKFGSAIPAVITSDGPIEGNLWGDDDGEPLPANATQQEKGIALADLLGGDIPVLPNGQKLEQLENKSPNDKVPDFITWLIGSFAHGLGLPPAFFLDEKLTGPNARAVNGKAQKKFNKRQYSIAAMIEWLWPRIIGWAIDHGELAVQEGFGRIEWQGPAKLSIDAGRESSQERDDVDCGLMTRQEHFSRRALNWKRETDQSLHELEYIIKQAQALSKASGVPLDIILARFGFEPKAAPPVQKQLPAPTDPNNPNQS